MMRIFSFTFAVALAIAGAAAAAPDPHAGHTMHPVTAPQSGITTVPANGAMTHGSPERFSATFPHAMILKTVTLTATGQPPIVVTAPAAPAAATVSVALPRLAPGTYAAAWAAEGADGHKMSGTISFMVH
jgi:methionine-rich copper-binding protein CopC